MKSYFFLITISLYGISAIFYFFYLSSFNEKIKSIAKIVLFFAFVFHLISTGYHHIKKEPPLILHPYSLLSLAALLLVGFFLFTEKIFKLSFYGAFLTPIITILLLAIFFNLSENLKPLIEVKALKFITPVHIFSSISGFFFFFISFIASILFLIKEMSLKVKKTISMGKIKLPSIAFLSKLIFYCIAVGFPLYTFGIILGWVWIYISGEGRWVFPQYFFAGLSWIFYAIILSLYNFYGWRGRKVSVFSIVAFFLSLCVVLTYGLR